MRPMLLLLAGLLFITCSPAGESRRCAPPDWLNLPTDRVVGLASAREKTAAVALEVARLAAHKDMRQRLLSQVAPARLKQAGVPAHTGPARAICEKIISDKYLTVGYHERAWLDTCTGTAWVRLDPDQEMVEQGLKLFVTCMRNTQPK